VDAPASAHHLHLHATHTDLPVIRSFTERCCQESGLDDEQTFWILLAVEEAITNIIEHAYAGHGGEIDMRCWRADDNFCILLNDRGRSFAPETVRMPDLETPLETRSIGGLGLYFMRKLMDEVQFTFDEEGNHLLMVKHHIAG
jgi:anti-sigma regulatory factor (Ser/Thr protein kinase)